jgi:hypothetical protein
MLVITMANGNDGRAMVAIYTASREKPSNPSFWNSTLTRFMVPAS